MIELYMASNCRRRGEKDFGGYWRKGASSRNGTCQSLGVYGSPDSFETAETKCNKNAT